MGETSINFRFTTVRGGSRLFVKGGGGGLSLRDEHIAFFGNKN